MLREDAVVDGRESVSAGEAQREDAEVTLEARADGETASGRVHARHVLRVVYILERQFLPVVPVTVVEVLTHQGVRLDGEVLVHLQTPASIVLPRHEHTGYWWSVVTGGHWWSVTECEAGP